MGKTYLYSVSPSSSSSSLSLDLCVCASPFRAPPRCLVVAGGQWDTQHINVVVRRNAWVVWGGGGKEKKGQLLSCSLGCRVVSSLCVGDNGSGGGVRT